MSDEAYRGTTPGAVPQGWYPDPAGAPAERWWDGAAWGHDTRPVSVLAQPLTAPVLTNRPATVGLVLAVVALLVNTFLVVTLAALVLCAVGLNRAGRLAQAGYAPVGRRSAIVGLVLAVLAGAGTVLFKGLLL